MGQNFLIPNERESKLVKMEEREPKLVQLINKLEENVKEAMIISEEFDKKSRALLDVHFNEEKKKSENPQPQGALPIIEGLINLLEESNNKNRETLSHLDELI